MRTYDCDYNRKIVNYAYMASRRDEVDLELVVQYPKAAREFIKGVDWGLLPRPSYICFGIDGKIWLDKMDDCEAVLAANLILKDIIIPTAQREFWLKYWSEDPRDAN
jgi:hypothetical protein